MESRIGKHVIEKVPIATISGEGAFRAGLVNAANRLGVELKCALACSSFPQAGKALGTGSFAAILPDIAANELDGDRFVRLDAPFLTKQGRDICLTWHRRLTKLRPETQKVVDCLAKILQLPQQK